MSRWLREKAERNRQALARLSKRLPTIFPPAVLARALGRPFIPPTPRLAIKSYWRAHPIRADRLARALAARTGPPVGWTWRISQSRKAGLPATFRTPPAPYRERAHRLGPGYCCVCGQPVYRTRLAQRSVGRRSKHERSMALCLRCCLAILECTE